MSSSIGKCRNAACRITQGITKGSHAMRKTAFILALASSGLILKATGALAASTPNSVESSKCRSLLLQFKTEAPALRDGNAWTLWPSANASCKIENYSSGIRAITEAMQQIGLHPKV
jgi:hypothetical protein